MVSVWVKLYLMVELKIVHSNEGDFKILVEKWYTFYEILWLISGSSQKMREVLHV